MTSSQQFSVLAERLRNFNREDYARLRSHLYYNLHTILEALDIAARITHDPNAR